jgi:parvulin-like peptidyl-prolyl isomerase
VRSLRGIAALVLIVALIGALAGCTKADVVARVNGEDITQEQFDRIYNQIVTQMGGEIAEDQALTYKKQLLGMLIESRLITQEAAELGADLSDDAIEAGVTELMGGSTDREAFEAQVVAAGLTMDDLRGSVRDQLAREFVTAKASEEPSSGTVPENYALLEHILVADEALAKDLQAQVVAGGDFAALAAANSTDPGSASQGGSLGWSPTSGFVKEFAEAADALEVGGVSEPVNSSFGWHIIRKVSEADAGEAVADVPADLQEILVANSDEIALMEYVAKLREKAKIEYLDETLAPAE